MTWAPLPTGAWGASAAVAGTDPALLWADATGFRDHLRTGQVLPRGVPVAVELAPGATPAMLAALADVPLAHQGSAMAQLTARANGSFLSAWLAGGYRSVVQRLELQMPVIPLRPRQLPLAVPVPFAPLPRARSRSAVLLGVIDNGCPFAHRMLRNSAGTGTRVQHLWDQSEPAAAFSGVGGGIPADFGYGVEIARPALDALMLASAPAAVDEARCYAQAGCDPLAQRFGHGAGVLGLLTAARPLDDGARLRAGAAWPHAADAASGADVVFVQVARDAVQDASSASLPRYVIDGLRYILSCAAEGQHVVVNLSDGTSRSPHDGSALVEQAIVAMVQEYARSGGTLEVVIAAGNNGDEERQAQLDALPPGVPQQLTLRVPPANETPVFVTLRLPGDGAGVQLRVTPPGAVAGAFVPVGQAWGWQDGVSGSPSAGLLLPLPPAGHAAMGLLVIAPTRRGERGDPVASAGDWRIEARRTPGSDASVEPLHLWVSRGQCNATALPRAFQARFIDTDATYDPARWRRPLDVDPVPPRSPIRRAVSLNALATVPTGLGVTVVGAALRRELAALPYASYGPAVSTAGSRGGADSSAPVDEHRGMRGMRLAGNLSGCTVRGMGSSFAAPQVARCLAAGLPMTYDPPRAGPDPARLGVGVLRP